MSLDEVRAHLSDIRKTCHVARLADLRDGETICWSVPDWILTVGIVRRVRHRERIWQEGNTRELPLHDFDQWPVRLLDPIGVVAALATSMLYEWRDGHRYDMHRAVADVRRRQGLGLAVFTDGDRQQEVTFSHGDPAA